MVAPMAMLLRYSLNIYTPTELMAEAFTPRNYVQVFADPYFREVLSTTLQVAAVTTLIALPGVFLFAWMWRAGLIDARIQSLRVQGEIISAAIAASATVNSDVIQVDPDRLLQLKQGSAVSSLSYFDPNLEFPINPEQVAPLLRNLVTPTRTRARIYDQGGFMILDS
eukprot:gene57936-77312_t